MREEAGTYRALLVGIVALAVVAAVVLATVGLASQSSPPATGSGFAPLPHLAITFAANSSSEVRFLLTSARPYLEPGDSFDLVSGSPENSTLSVSNLQRWSEELRAAYPWATISFHTAGVGNLGGVAPAAIGNASGVLYDYEPGFEPEFSFNFTATLANFQNATAIAHANGVRSIGYPIGRMLLDPALQKYDWNYATLAGTVDQLIVQTQTYCAQGVPRFAEATGLVLAQFKAANLTSVPTFQVTIGNATTALPNGVTAVPAYDCAAQLTGAGLSTLYLWWDIGGESNLLAFLQDIGRGSSA